MDFSYEPSWKAPDNPDTSAAVPDFAPNCVNHRDIAAFSQVLSAAALPLTICSRAWLTSISSRTKGEMNRPLPVRCFRREANCQFCWQIKWERSDSIKERRWQISKLCTTNNALSHETCSFKGAQKVLLKHSERITAIRHSRQMFFQWYDAWRCWPNEVWLLILTPGGVTG